MMSETRAQEILKEAILLEVKGQAFYRKVAEQAGGPAVKDFFEIMADEESRHIDVLSKQYRALSTDGRFADPGAEMNASGRIDAQVLTPKLKEQISAADFESAAISAAVAMEKNAVRLYTERAGATGDPNEKKLYGWLAAWEQDHLNFLAQVESELREKIWHDQNFWPF